MSLLVHGFCLSCLQSTQLAGHTWHLSVWTQVIPVVPGIIQRLLWDGKMCTCISSQQLLVSVNTTSNMLILEGSFISLLKTLWVSYICLMFSSNSKCSSFQQLQNSAQKLLNWTSCNSSVFPITCDHVSGQISICSWKREVTW